MPNLDSKIMRVTSGYLSLCQKNNNSDDISWSNNSNNRRILAYGRQPDLR
jgi:hypothetical protein